jgi:Dolichyl-phosphate-mannose-protein mannosyltransferase
MIAKPSIARRALGLLIVVSTGLRLIWAWVLDVGNDEAYHYLYTVHPDWSYFDHPPMMMWVQQLGLQISGVVTPLSLRLGFILLFAGSTWVLFRWTARWYGEWPGFYAALGLNITAYFTAAAGAFVLPDGPLLFFSLLTLWALTEALVGQPGRLWPWIWVGLAWGGALLSKYHAVFVPTAALLYILATPNARRFLRSPGPYIAVAIGLVGFLPVIVWNARNDWASFSFQGDRALGWHFQPESLLRTVVGQILYLFPWIWFDLVLVLVCQIRVARKQPGVERLVAFQAAVPLGFFLAVSLVRTNLPHWSLIGFVPLYPALGAKWAQLLHTSPKWMRRRLAIGITVTVGVAILVAAQARLGMIPLEKEPTMEMSGWPSVARELDERGLVGKPGTFLFTGRWFTSGHLAFAIRNRGPVLCYNSVESHGFAYWSSPAEWIGQDGYLITFDDRPEEPEVYAEFFRGIELIAEFPMTRNGTPFRNVRLYHCIDQVQPFPFRVEARRR